MQRFFAPHGVSAVYAAAPVPPQPRPLHGAWGCALAVDIAVPHALAFVGAPKHCNIAPSPARPAEDAVPPPFIHHAHTHTAAGDATISIATAHLHVWDAATIVATAAATDMQHGKARGRPAPM